MTQSPRPSLSKAVSAPQSTGIDGRSLDGTACQQGAVGQVHEADQVAPGPSEGAAFSAYARGSTGAEESCEECGGF
jgi:hypothetical protein